MRATKRLTLPKVEVEISKEIYSSSTAEDTIKISEEEKASWFKSTLETSGRMVEHFDIEIKIFSRVTLKENILSRRYDSNKDLYVIIRKDWQMMVLRETKRNLRRYSYSIENVEARQRVRQQAPRDILPQYNERRVHNTLSLQPFTRAYVDSVNKELVAYKSKDEFEAKDFISIIKKLANQSKGLPKDG
ncbi:hypothetical protein L1987_64222 [Smallanthus sonchifolius]|uniref:Uncharacterized protein n=1 Tax=Smallanthus sonchifolius TaxID=185202 RepID=A0ACB9CFR7_9ASTR|nr:hypothetical protein L1987_64222 [Smallanthus sonchifolius]